jgi:hypothetical protein
LVLDAEEVFLGTAGAAAVAERLEILLGATGDSSFRKGVADQGAAAAGSGANEI